MSVIVTNAKNRIAYNVAKSLGQRGIEVYTSDFVRVSMSFASRYSKGHFLYPSPFKDQAAFINSIIDNSNRLGSDTVIPVFEETFLISKYKNQLEKHVNLAVPEYEQILAVHNKDRMESIANTLGIPVPRSCAALEARRDFSAVKGFRYPLLLKPKQGGGGWSIMEIATSGELEMILSEDNLSGVGWERFIIQEKIKGEVHCVAMLFRKGEYRARVTYKQVRDFPVGKGQATFRVSLHNENAEGYLKKILEHLSWHGVCQADFVVDSATGTPYLIDINPRFWGSLAQAMAAGVDFPYLVYMIATKGDVEPVKDFKAGVYTRWLGGELRSFLPILMSSSNKLGFMKEFFIAKYPNVIYDDFSLEDPFPFFTWLFDSAYRIMRSRSLSPTTHDSLEGVWE